MTEEEYEAALKTARESAGQAHHVVLIDRVTTQMRHCGVEVALNHHIIYQVRAFVGSRKDGQGGGKSRPGPSLRVGIKRKARRPHRRAFQDSNSVG